MDGQDALRERMTGDLRGNILPFWLERAVDRERGGFHGEMLRDGTVVPGAGKGLILNARILWAFSSAARVLGAAEYRAGADRAFAYITEHFMDRAEGGGFYMLDPLGAPASRAKMTYAQGFLLYAFSEYARATGKPEAFAEARGIFGYLLGQCREGGVWLELAKGSEPPPMPPPPPPAEGAPEPPPFDFGRIITMNTCLHVMEPLTCYFRIDHSAEAEGALADLLETFLDRIYNREFRHFDLFFTDGWRPLSRTNSYGHDIEGSWLIAEAAEVLARHAADRGRAERLLSRARECALEMAGAVLAEGLAPDTGAVYDEGDRDGGITNDRRVWWAQAEGVVGFFNAWQLSGEERFLRAAGRVWDYIEGHVIDREGGEWFGTGTDSPEDENSGYKINPWKCPYHNARAALEIHERTTARSDE